MEQTAISGVKMFKGGLSQKWERGNGSCLVCWICIQESAFVMLLPKFFFILQGNLSLSLVKDVSRSKSSFCFLELQRSTANKKS